MQGKHDYRCDYAAIACIVSTNSCKKNKKSEEFVEMCPLIEWSDGQNRNCKWTAATSSTTAVQLTAQAKSPSSSASTCYKSKMVVAINMNIVASRTVSCAVLSDGRTIEMALEQEEEQKHPQSSN